MRIGEHIREARRQEGQRQKASAGTTVHQHGGHDVVPTRYAAKVRKTYRARIHPMAIARYLSVYTMGT